MATDAELKQAAIDYVNSNDEINRLNEQLSKINSVLLSERNKQDRAEKVLEECVGSNVKQRTFKVTEYQAVHVVYNDDGKYVELLELE